MPDNKKNKRYAFEWFMRAEDQRYWRRTKELVEQKTKRATRRSMIFTAALWGMTIICFWFRLYKSR